MYSRRDFMVTTGAAGATLAGAGAAAAQGESGRPAFMPSTAGESEKLFIDYDDDLATASFDRLPLEHSKGRTRVLQDYLRDNGYSGILLTDRWNLIYFTGLWHSTTERLFHAFISTDRDHPIWFYPGLDRDLVASWWSHEDDMEMYHDWHHAEGGFPHLGEVKQGPAVDLFKWVMEGLKKRGFADKKLAIDSELPPSKQKKVVDVLGAPMADESGFCMNRRMRKTRQELELTRKAYTYFDKIHAYARDLILEHGTDLTDYDVANAAMHYGTDLIMNDIERDGRPHTAVGIRVGIGVRSGVGTGYPHPNQFHHNPIKKGDALQVAGGVRIGGYGGELYRAYLIEPYSDLMKDVWTVSRDGCLMQKEESRAGETCASVAYKIHKMQVERGMQEYIYHRPAHGEGVEGHQPPYLALGDQTVLDPGMCFSVEPGLYAPEEGFGCNWSDMFTVREQGPALQMSRLPWSEDWCLIKL